MTPQQLTAYKHPCFKAEDTTHSRFRPERIWRGNLMFGTKLTVNVGSE